MEFNHTSVLLEECIQGLAIKANGVYIDGTAGGAGHSTEIAKKLSEEGRLFAIDKDPNAIAVAKQRLLLYDMATTIQDDFSNIEDIVKQQKIISIDGILLDLGVSSHQLDEVERGFSYHNDAPLDMRMSQEGLSAADLVNTYSQQDLTRIFREFGEEKFASRIAYTIVKDRENKTIDTTLELVEIIKKAIPAAARREGGHPAKRVFQAIRIAVNGELDSLSKCLDTAFDLLAQGGRFAIITFHSLEDRMVKQKFSNYAKGCTCPPKFPICVCHKEPKGTIINRKPIIATQQELLENKRSRSAKLRIIEKN
ncbi:MAG: 16S rRNA (cytosine(1402)-N(4))-methyltransferase RsmH [Oscillospiraceae bacterium]